ncbi:ABC transporter substrate-binding protein [bacterium]|nr:ABC transporter substrate-binding protein [bacterium]
MPPAPHLMPLGVRLAAIGLLVLPPLLQGCTRKADSSVPAVPEASAPRQGGSFHMMFEGPGTLDPCLVDDVYESCIINQLYDGLLELDPNLNPVPAIAREWSVSRDGLVYTMTLRDDVRFHNGRKVVADDAVFSYTRIFDPERGDFGLGGEYLQRIEGATAYFEGKAESISGLSAPNDSTLVIRLEKAYGSFLSALAMDQTKIVPKEELERWGEEFGLHPVGTGPFVYDRFEDNPEDPHIVLTANEDFYRRRAYIDELVFHVPDDYNVDKGAQALLAGILSMCDLPGDWRAKVDADPRFQVIRRPELSFSFIGVNVEAEPFRDERVRRAVAHAVNRERIMSVDPVGRIPAVGILPPGMFGYSPEPKALTYDPEASRRLLAEAGYPGGKGLPPLRHFQADRGGVGRQADQILREDLAAVGLDLQFTYTDWDQFSDDLDAYRLPSFGLTWVADLPDPDSFLASLFSTNGVYNLFHYSNPEVDELLAQGSVMRSSIDRAQLYRSAEVLILNDVPVIPLFHIANNFAVRREVKDLIVTPFGYGNLAIENLWLAPPAS